jgi:hypothetical protein
VQKTAEAEAVASSSLIAILGLIIVLAVWQ